MTAAEAKQLALQCLRARQTPAGGPTPPAPPQQGIDLDDFLPEDEAVSLILNFAHARGDRGIFEDEVAELLQAAAYIRLQSATLDLAVKGLLFINVDLNRREGDRIEYRVGRPELTQLLRERHAERAADPRLGG